MTMTMGGCVWNAGEFASHLNRALLSVIWLRPALYA